MLSFIGNMTVSKPVRNIHEQLSAKMVLQCQDVVM